MSAAIVDLANMVVTLLEESSLSQPVRPVRMYEPRFTIAELDQLRTSVVPFSAAFERATRNEDYADFGITIGIQARVANANPETIDPLVAVSEEVAGVLRQARPAGYAMQSVEIDPVFDADDLRELRVFTSIITVVFRTVL